MTSAFSCRDLIKKYPDFTLGPLNLKLNPGTVLGYVGPNGSGKTTTMHCLTGLVRFEQGEIAVFGKPNDPGRPEWKQDIGYVGDAHVFYERWSAADNLKFISQFYPNWSDKLAAGLSKRFRLPMQKRARDLSGGNRVKLSLVAALSHSPRLLLLDEPTAGLDPVVRSEVLETLFELFSDGERAIFYSTHILSDISRLVDELAFIHEGRILKRAAKEDLTEKWIKLAFKCSRTIKQAAGIVEIRQSGEDYQAVSENGDRTIAALRSLGVTKLTTNRMGVEEIALHILKGAFNGTE